MIKTIGAIVACLFLLFYQSLAQDSNTGELKFLIEGGIEYGGAEIIEVIFVNPNEEDGKIRAGGGPFVTAGFQFQHAKVSAFLIRASMGIKFNTGRAEYANLRLLRFPINLLAYWKAREDIRIGLGLSTHLHGRFRGDSFFDDFAFTSSIGPRFEIGYKWVALTGTVINYRLDGRNRFSASSMGISVSRTFPKK